MKIDLTEEMVQNILEVSFGRICSLKEKIRILNDWMKLCAPIKSESEVRRRKIRLNDLKDQLRKAEEVHEVFNGFISDDEETKPGGNKNEI